ncbi:hypothetical protein [Oceanospirillum sp.]|uniref:hypothetical protein n=1 Tax=Oceanospirillum sp. TaxID=2021254 RepID=UPI003A90789A
MQTSTLTVVIATFTFFLGMTIGMVSDISFSADTFNDVIGGTGSLTTALIAAWAAITWKKQTSYIPKVNAITGYKKTFELWDRAMIMAITTSAWDLPIKNDPVHGYVLPPINNAQDEQNLIKLENQIKSIELAWENFQNSEIELEIIDSLLGENVQKLHPEIYQLHRDYLDTLKVKTDGLRNKNEPPQHRLKRGFEIDIADSPNKRGTSGWDKSIKQYKDKILQIAAS